MIFFCMNSENINILDQLLHMEEIEQMAMRKFCFLVEKT